jgi:hypothetical protein
MEINVQTNFFTQLTLYILHAGYYIIPRQNPLQISLDSTATQQGYMRVQKFKYKPDSGPDNPFLQTSHSHHLFQQASRGTQRRLVFFNLYSWDRPTEL